MASCGYCGSTVIFGGVKTQDNSERFCNKKCYQGAVLLSMSDRIPADVVNRQIESLHQGLCPKCQGRGPVDVHTKYRVWSALIVTSWNNIPQISCRSCGRKAQVTGLLTSLLFGWWGFPWGFIMTPVQITRNIIGMVKGPDDLRPSAMLQKMVRIGMASEIARTTEPTA